MRASLLAFLLLATSTVWAQGPDLDAARRHFMSGQKAYNQKDFPTAELEFRAAFAITRDPLLFYNIGQAQQHRGHLEDAIRSYKAYLEGVPNAEDRPDVEKVIRDLEQELSAAHVQPPPPAPPPERRPAPTPPPAPQDHGARRQSAWIASGAAVALLGAGIAFSALSASNASDANDLYIDPKTGQPRPYSGDVREKYDSAKSDATKFGGLAIGMYVAAAVSAGLSVYLFYSSRPTATEEQSQARLRVAPAFSSHGAGLLAGMEF